MTQTKTIKDEFLDACNYALNFLTNEYGFRGPVLQENNLTIKESYFKNEIAIDSALDIKDEMISFRIVKLTNGEEPKVWRVKKNGEIVKEYLTELLINI